MRATRALVVRALEWVPKGVLFLSGHPRDFGTSDVRLAAHQTLTGNWIVSKNSRATSVSNIGVSKAASQAVTKHTLLCALLSRAFLKSAPSKRHF
jgi:hypothetical protein